MGWVIPGNDDTNTYVWEMNDPMATQVTTVVIGEIKALWAKKEKRTEGVAVAEEIAGRDLSEVGETWLYGTTLSSELTLLSGKVFTIPLPDITWTSSGK